ncbi:hypothetical protein BV20DRAFT_788949 [Pilatotrama ljubarskyi]|nr:hypothetical protein BV20DRAFT_788949 [Pilatotrama ljubarskyi]
MPVLLCSIAPLTTLALTFCVAITVLQLFVLETTALETRCVHRGRCLSRRAYLRSTDASRVWYGVSVICGQSVSTWSGRSQLRERPAIHPSMGFMGVRSTVHGRATASSVKPSPRSVRDTVSVYSVFVHHGSHTLCARYMAKSTTKFLGVKMVILPESMACNHPFGTIGAGVSSLPSPVT